MSWSRIAVTLIHFEDVQRRTTSIITLLIVMVYEHDVIFDAHLGLYLFMAQVGRESFATFTELTDSYT